MHTQDPDNSPPTTKFTRTHGMTSTSHTCGTPGAPPLPPVHPLSAGAAAPERQRSRGRGLNPEPGGREGTLPARERVGGGAWRRRLMRPGGAAAGSGGFRWRATLRYAAPPPLLSPCPGVPLSALAARMEAEPPSPRWSLPPICRGVQEELTRFLSPGSEQVHPGPWPEFRVRIRVLRRLWLGPGTAGHGAPASARTAAPVPHH